MKTWSIKEVCKLAYVSARALHYYDKIGLLKPSARSANGYRVYSEEDLHKLEKIMALKFLGFMLNPIQSLVEVEDSDCLLKNLNSQLICLQQDIEHIEEGQIKLLQKMVERISTGKEINWKSLNEEVREYVKRHEERTKDLHNRCIFDQFSGMTARFQNNQSENELE